MSYNTGVIYALTADLIWGLAFIIPKLLPSYSAVEITFGRYFIYGTFSLIMWFIRRRSIATNKVKSGIWLQALLFAFCGNVGYYLFLVFAIQLAGITISTLVIGMLPISVSLYGNWLFREFAFKKVFPSILLVLFGLIIINSSKLQGADTLSNNILGLFSGLTALMLWTWYGVANACFLKDNPGISSEDWSTITGVTTFVLLPFFLFIVNLIYLHSFSISHIFEWNENSWRFWVGSFVLGLFCSWGATIFWNKASNQLPTAVAGQLIVGETIFGLIYGYIFEHRLPYFIEVIGIIIIISGVLLSIHTINSVRGLIEHGYVQKEQG
ncbi:DMT family transporter [Sporomusa malonica]|uniref:Permease of the drug/metabolite transporter (DMT) superfamily n=1 Tax=Sporomusa malonica TaxID=112901 RepID=A0A1W2F5P7_9FIRM|nr:DMT family transporter [Sporomusa malonica]SMD17249.1 Permease of the drug/metabolite transporter (DMT) superfamily [Sporomusa malonica]